MCGHFALLTEMPTFVTGYSHCVGFRIEVIDVLVVAFSGVKW